MHGSWLSPPSASAAFFQVCILCMTIFKYIVGHHYGWARTPLTSLMLRDGTVVCFLIFGELISVHTWPLLTLDLGMLVLNMVYEKIREFGLGLALWDTSFAYVLLQTSKLSTKTWSPSIRWYISLLSVTVGFDFISFLVVKNSMLIWQSYRDVGLYLIWESLQYLKHVAFTKITKLSSHRILNFLVHKPTTVTLDICTHR